MTEFILNPTISINDWKNFVYSELILYKKNFQSLIEILGFSLIKKYWKFSILTTWDILNPGSANFPSSSSKFCAPIATHGMLAHPWLRLFRKSDLTVFETKMLFFLSFEIWWNTENSNFNFLCSSLKYSKAFKGKILFCLGAFSESCLPNPAVSKGD